MARILIVDDYPEFSRLLVSLLTMHRHECRSATDAAEGIREGLAFAPDLLIADWRLKEAPEGGLGVARALRAANPGLKIMLMSGSPAAHIQSRLGDFTVDRIVEKPFNALQEVLSILGPPA